MLLPRQQAKLARGAKDKEHAMFQIPNTAIGDVFSKGRDFGAWLGLVPKEISTETARSLAKSRGVAIATCAFCSCRRLELRLSK